MKYLLIAVILTTFIGCGKKVEYVVVKGEKGDVGSQGNPGTDGGTGPQGNTGATGATGADGSNGHNSLIYSVSSTGCINGGITVLSGVDVNDNFVLDIGEVTASADVCNGADGQDGEDGADAPPTGFTPVALLNPCGDNPSVFDEVFLKLSNGTVLASFSDSASGLNTRFSVLVPGTYSTTDGDGCVFTIDGSGSFTYQNHVY